VTAQAESEPAVVRLRWAGEIFYALPNLYVLAVGVSVYQRPELALKYPAKDAQDLARVFQHQAGHLYSHVVTEVLTDEGATYLEILRKLEWLQRQMSARDVAVVFLAGHGFNDSGSGEYYFLAHDADPANTHTTMVSQHELQSTLRHTAGKVLLFLDTCHSGNVFPEWRTRGIADVRPWILEMISSDSGVIVFSAATSGQASQESDGWNNGAFTKALVEGLQGQAAYYANRPVTVNMLEVYVSERVKQLTAGSQTPTVAKPASVPDFPLALPLSAVQTLGSSAAPSRAGSPPLYKRWWLWAGVAVIVGSVVVGAAVGASRAAALRNLFADVPVIYDLMPK